MAQLYCNHSRCYHVPDGRSDWGGVTVASASRTRVSAASLFFPSISICPFNPWFNPPPAVFQRDLPSLHLQRYLARPSLILLCADCSKDTLKITIYNPPHLGSGTIFVS